MTAGQQKRQSDGACSISTNCIQEVYAEKRKNNLELSRWYRRMRPHIALEWNEAHEKIVARKGQVGITWRYFSPFYEPSKCNSHRDLADVFIIPEEIYELKDLKHVLSYEVWNTCLSDSERKLLSEFLPKEVDAKSVLRSLFLGQNFHFGNPLITWGSSLCSGGFHPDAVSSRELDFRARKKVYYSVLRNYHNDMLETLQRWKEIWESCKNPETELLQRIWEGSQKYSIANVQETSIGGNTVVINSEKQEYILSNTIKIDQDSEFIKISQKPHASILKMKQTGEELQLESVDATFGDTKSIDIQSFATLEESNKEKFREYWILLIERDLPIVHAKFVQSCLQRHHLRKKLEKEILEWQELLLYKASCKEKVLELKCNKKGMAQYSEETSLPVTNVSGCTISKADLSGKSDLQIAQPHSGSNIQYGSRSKSSKSFDKEELFAEHALAIDSLPGEKSNMCWSPSLNMTSETSVSQIKSEKCGNFMLKLENLHPVHFSPEFGMGGNSGFTSEQPVSKDDALLSVKETRSSAHFDSQEFHLHDMAGSTVKESDNFIGRKRPSSWTPPKLVEETFDDDSIRGDVISSDPEKKARFGLGKAGLSQDAVHQQIHTSLGTDQLAKNQRHSFFVSNDENGGMESHVLHLSQPLSSEKPRGELELHPFKEREIYPDTQILSLGMDDRPTQGSDLSLGQPQQSDKDDHPFKLGSQRFERHKMKNALQAPFLDHLTKEVTTQNMQSDEAHSLFVSSPHVIQARGKKHSFHQEINQTGLDHSLPIEQIKGQTLQGFQHPSCLTQELQFLTDNKSTERQSQLQQREIIQSGKQEGFNEHLQEPWIFNQNERHENQSRLFQCPQQNQSLQHSGQQDDFHSGLSPGVIPSWPGPLQVAPRRPVPATANPQFHPQPGNWNGTDNHFHASLCPEFMQRTSITGQCFAGDKDERKLFGPLPQLERLPQSTYGILNHTQNGIMKTYQHSSSSGGNNYHGQDDWVQHQNSHSNPQYSYHPQEVGSAYRAGHIPWINIPPTLYANSQIAHFRQKSSGMSDFKGGEHI